MATETEIVNAALVRMGSNLITALTDSTREAAIAKEVYPKIRRMVLRDLCPQFARVRLALGQLSTAPLFGPKFAYGIPADCLRVLKMKNDAKWSIENQGGQRVIVTDETAANVLYIKDIDDPTLWDDVFVEAIVTRLTAEFALAIATNVNLRVEQMKEYELMRRDAQSVDAIESNDPRFIYDTQLVDVRGSGGSGSVSDPTL